MTCFANQAIRTAAGIVFADVGEATLCYGSGWGDWFGVAEMNGLLVSVRLRGGSKVWRQEG